jgi:hypothetical protein
MGNYSLLDNEGQGIGGGIGEDDHPALRCTSRSTTLRRTWTRRSKPVGN